MDSDPYSRGNDLLRSSGAWNEPQSTGSGYGARPSPPPDYDMYGGGARQPAGGNLFDGGYNLRAAPGYGETPEPTQLTGADSAAGSSHMSGRRPTALGASGRGFPTRGGARARGTSPDQFRSRSEVDTAFGSVAPGARGPVEQRGGEGRRYVRKTRDVTASESLMAEEKAQRKQASGNTGLTAGLLAGGLVLGAVVGGAGGWLFGKLWYGSAGYVATKGAAVGSAGATPGMTQAAASATHAAAHAGSEEAAAAAVASMAVPPVGVTPAAAAALAAHNAAAPQAVTAAVSALNSSGAHAMATQIVTFSEGAGAGCVAAGAAVGGASGAVGGVAAAEIQQRRLKARGALPAPTRGEVTRAP